MKNGRALLFVAVLGLSAPAAVLAEVPQLGPHQTEYSQEHRNGNAEYLILHRTESKAYVDIYNSCLGTDTNILGSESDLDAYATIPVHANKMRFSGTVPEQDPGGVTYHIHMSLSVKFTPTKATGTVTFSGTRRVGAEPAGSVECGTIHLALPKTSATK